MQELILCTIRSVLPCSAHGIRLAALAALFAAAACAGNPGGKVVKISPEDVVRKRLLEGPDGLRIEAVELKGKQALLRISGSQELLDGKVLRGTVARTVKGSIWFFTAIRGRRSSLFGRHAEDKPWRYEGIARRGLFSLKLVDRSNTKATADIDPQAMQETHQKQKAAGELAFQDYSRSWWIEELKQYLAKNVTTLKRKCGAAPKVVVQWERVDDALIKKHKSWLVTACIRVLTDLQDLCQADGTPARELVKRLETIRCNPADGERVKLSGKTLEYAHRPRASPRPDILKLSIAKDQTLGQAMVVARSDVCLQGKHRVIMRGDVRPGRRTLAYGSAGRYLEHGQLLRTLGPTHKCRSFFDPRHTKPRDNGLSWLSCVEVKRETGSCTLRCGDRSKTLKLANKEIKAETLQGAKYQQSPLTRLPHALARDRRGTYYYVDRGRGQAGSRDFRVFIGRRGRMRAQRMKDVVTDSEGQIFETQKGKLRLIFSKSSGQWIRNRYARKLTLVPVKRNLQLIYRELGVYWGKRLGTPCDDF